MQEIFYSPNQIAQKYNVSDDVVRKWIREGKLRALKLGGVWRVSESALQQFIKDNGNKCDPDD